MSIPTTSIQHCAGGSSQCNKAEVDNNKNKGDAVWEERSKLSFFADSIIVYTEYPKRATKDATRTNRNI